MWLLKRCSTVTPDVHMGAQVCAQGCRNMYVGEQELYHYASALFNVPFSRFPQTVPLGGGTPEWVLCATLEGRAQVWESEPDWRLRPRGRLARRCGTLQQLLTPHPQQSQPCLCDQVLLQLSLRSCAYWCFFFFFLLSLKSLMNSWTLVEKEEDTRASGLSHPQLFCWYHDLHLLALWSTKQNSL